MKYYKIEFSLDIKEIGNYPQIQKFKKGYNPNRKESCSQIARHYFGIKPDVMVDFDCLELSNKAKLTDYISASYLNALTGLLISRRLFEFLSEMRMPEYSSFQAYIYQKEVRISDNYVWVHFISRYPELVDFSKSIFYFDHSEANHKEISVRSFAEYNEMQKKVQYKVNARRLVLKKEFVSSFDVLRIGVILNETFVTETMKNEMLAKGFTGMIFEPADHLIVE